MSKILINSLLLIAALFISIELMPQQRPDNVVPYPELAREYQKYIGYPVSMATGIPDINIPLFDVKVDNYNIPFSLNYHSSGIKVTQSPGLVGYGWSLMPSFRITRAIHNKEDDRYIVNANEVRSAQDMHEVFYTENYSTINDNIKYLEGITSSGYAHVYEIDTEYDIFTIQLPTCSGSFVLQRVNNTIQVTKINSNALKIIPKLRNNEGGIYGFEVVDENGILYKFGYYPNENISEEYTEFSASSHISSAWMLYKIILPGSREITFTYTGRNTVDYEFSTIWWKKDIILDWMNVFGPTIDLETGLAELGLSSGLINGAERRALSGGTDIQSYNCLPKSIIFPSGRVDFGYQSPNSWQLNKIALLNSSGQEVKNVTFQRNVNRYRSLASVSLTDGGTYHFEYNANGFKSMNSQDYWGYNNNKENSSLEPKMTIKGGKMNTSFNIGGGDREPSEIHMKAHILEKITYPTGGYTSFNYEANRYYDYVSKTTKLAGGLRIKEMKTYDPSSGKIINKTYKYGLNESGHGNPIYIPLKEHFLRENYTWEFGSLHTFELMNYRQRETTTSSYLDYYLSTNTPIWYNYVTEYSDGGKTVYEYDYVPDQLTDSRYYSNGDFFINHYYSYISSKPDLKKRSVYKIENNVSTLVNQTVNTYTLIEQGDPIKGLLVSNYTKAPSRYNNRWSMMIDELWPGRDDIWFRYLFGLLSIGPDYLYSFDNYYIHRGVRHLVSATETDYRENGNVIKTVTYNYDNTHPYNLKEQQENTSRNTSMVTRYYYPYESIEGVNTSMLNLLITNNRYSSVVQKETLEGSTFLSAERILYKNYGNNLILPEELLSKKHRDSSFGRQVYYDLYDICGNLRQYTTKDGVSTVYLWGYNYQYPIAEIKNATYAQIKDILTEALINRVASSSVPTDSDVLAINNLRKNTTLPNILVSTFKYKIMVGMIDATDPSGNTTTYEYDTFNRLEFIKDRDLRKVQENKYNYKNQ